MPLHKFSEGVDERFWGNFIGFDNHPREMLNYNENEYENAAKYINACFLTGHPLKRFDEPLYGSEDSSEHVGKTIPKFARLNWENFPIKIIPGDTGILLSCLCNPSQ